MDYNIYLKEEEKANAKLIIYAAKGGHPQYEAKIYKYFTTKEDAENFLETEKPGGSPPYVQEIAVY